MRWSNQVIDRRPLRRGFTLLYMAIGFAVVLAIVSFGVDLGRVQAAKTELQRAVDAAARYGAKGLSDNTAVAKAITAGADNAIDADNNQALALTSNDVKTGHWDSTTKTFTIGGSPTDAVRVSSTRTIPLLFAAALGKRECSVTATAIATNLAAAPNFIGLNGITAKNNASMGYSSSQGSAGGTNVNSDFIMGSNAAISFVQNPSITGTIVLGPSGTYNQTSPTPSYTPTMLSYPSTESPPTSSSGDLSVSGTVHISGGGTKVYTNINFSNNATLIFDSPTTIYVTGNVNAAQSSLIKPASGIPKDLMIRMTGGASAVFGGGNNMTVIAQVYAPAVNFTSQNNADLYGSMLFRSINVQNNINVYYDSDSGNVITGTVSTGHISMVR